ncbi:hypothetical protein V2J09_021341 [Rumex salicifolius]
MERQEGSGGSAGRGREFQTGVIVVGAGPSGLATAACLSQESIPYVVVEREECIASLWRNKAYARLHLHLKKRFCQLPHMPFPAHLPDYLPRDAFLRYLHDYSLRFRISPLFNRVVTRAAYDHATGMWRVRATHAGHEAEELVAPFLVVATGETCDPFVPEVDGLLGFSGRALHSTLYKTGEHFAGQSVLVVGSGNSGMEIALDLSNHHAKPSILIRSPVHIMSRWMINLGLNLLKILGVHVVDSLMVMLSKVVYGDLSKHGILRPKEGPFLMKVKYGKYPVVDVGTISKIQAAHIQVLPAAIRSIRDGNEVMLDNGNSYHFDAIVFATGFRRSTNNWLMGDNYLLNEDGFPKPSFPNHWKGKHGLYCTGLSRRGLYGAALDAQNIARDIKTHFF